MIHELKCNQEFFIAICEGRKRFEIRKNDRAFSVGDHLRLREWDSELEEYVDGEVTVEVLYMTDWEQREGYVVMSIRVLKAEHSYPGLPEGPMPDFGMTTAEAAVWATTYALGRERLRDPPRHVLVGPDSDKLRAEWEMGIVCDSIERAGYAVEHMREALPQIREGWGGTTEEFLTNALLEGT